ncbi:similar to cytochrome P450 [Paecilomyces variotii No. 5]|uniref:Similar to cytochrome P450 n=1 Tax=Byssochlamys spectabilis (strain No. 5 / NBRC 109023) TaxID=1356009 RepID=V5G193_BYSSN|nr:similar to cytochrome P450 [Paecilomyces variotii No. 5]
MIFSETIVVLGILTVVLFTIYYVWAKIADSKPLPGIPSVTVWSSAGFNVLHKTSPNVPESEQIMGWLERKCIELDTPILQIRTGLPGKPNLVVADSVETQRILTNILHEFDRRRFLAASFLALMPYNHMTMPTNDEWRANRRLIAETMSPHLLLEKNKKSAGRSFEVLADTFGVMLDGIVGATFGTDTGAVKTQLKFIQDFDGVAPIDGNRGFANLPRAPDPPLLDALVLLMWSLHIPTHPLGGPFFHKMAMRFVPRYRDALALVRSYLDDIIKRAEQKRQQLEENEELDSSTGVDLIVKHEIELAKSQDRAPYLHSGLLRDELFGILFGYDVLAIMAIRGLKILTTHQDIQQRLRAELKSTFPEAAAAGTVPSAEKIATTSTPYLDAVYEEMLRCVGSTPALVRTTTQDVNLMNHHIPKGTAVFLLTRGRSYTHRGTDDVNVGEKSIGDASKDVWTGNWPPEEISRFDAERWLTLDGDGRKRFNARAGPRHMLGTGVRACFGQKQATSVMRIFFTLVVWKLELRPIPTDLARFKRADAAFVYRAKEVYVSPQAFV